MDWQKHERRMLCAVRGFAQQQLPWGILWEKLWKNIYGNVHLLRCIVKEFGCNIIFVASKLKHKYKYETAKASI